MNLETKRRKKPSNSREDWRRQLTDQIRQQQQEHQFQQQHFQIGGFSFDQHDQSQHIQMSLSQVTFSFESYAPSQNNSVFLWFRIR